MLGNATYSRRLLGGTIAMKSDRVANKVRMNSGFRQSSACVPGFHVLRENLCISGTYVGPPLGTSRRHFPHALSKFSPKFLGFACGGLCCSIVVLFVHNCKDHLRLEITPIRKFQVSGYGFQVLFQFGFLVSGFQKSIQVEPWWGASVLSLASDSPINFRETD